MQRRITLAVLAVAVAAVVLAGVGTTLLTWLQVRRDAVTQLRDDARALEPFVTREVVRDGLAEAAEVGPPSSERLVAARQALRLVDASVLVVDRDGRVLAGTVPVGADPEAAVSTSGRTSAQGVKGRLAWAAASSPPTARGRRVVVVLTRTIRFPLGALRWVVLSALVAAALSVAAAALVARRITGPLRDVEVATGRIAAGDLTARVGDPGGAAGEEMASLARSINAMADSLERSRGAEQEFLLSISHDLRTPLTSVRGYAEAIGDAAVDDPRAAAEVIVREAQRLERLVADLLDLARLEARQFSLRLGPADLSELVNRSVSGFLPAAAAANLRLDVAGTTAPLAVTVDADRVAQVLANLVENALRYAARRVVVEVGRSGPWASVTVSDDGPGIAPADLPHVFERRYQARAVGAAPSRSSGSGLGLAIVRELVAAMGGTVQARPGADGAGTVVEVLLPTTSASAPPPSPATPR